MPIEVHYGLSIYFDFADADGPHPRTVDEAHQIVEAKLAELGVQYERIEP